VEAGVLVMLLLVVVAVLEAVEMVLQEMGHHPLFHPLLVQQTLAVAVAAVQWVQPLVAMMAGVQLAVQEL